MDWACWLLERPNAFTRKTVRLAREERAEAARERARKRSSPVSRAPSRTPGDGVTLLIAPTGSRKSTTMRAAAVRLRDRTSRRERGDPGAAAQARRRAGQGAARRNIPTPRSRPRCGAGGIAMTRKRRIRNIPASSSRCAGAARRRRSWRRRWSASTRLCKQGRGEKAVRCPHFEQLRLPAAETDQGQHLARGARDAWCTRCRRRSARSGG